MYLKLNELILYLPKRIITSNLSNNIRYIGNLEFVLDFFTIHFKILAFKFCL